MAERDFSNYEAGDRLYELGNGVVPRVAELIHFTLDEEPNDIQLSELVGKLGKDKVLQNNEPPVELDIETSARLVEDSGVQKAVSRSLWTSDETVPGDVDAVIVTGAVANWQDRTAKLLIAKSRRGFEPKRVYLPTGNRVMNSATEIVNRNVVGFRKKHNDELPTENQYAEAIIAPRLEKAGLNVEVIPYATKDGAEIANRFIVQHTELISPHKKITVARVANAGIQLAVQIRRSARQIALGFDYDQTDPQLFVMTDRFPIAKTAQELKQSKEFQSPFTALRQVVLTGRYLVKEGLLK